MAAPRDEVAVVTSDKVASEPEVRPAPVRVRVPLVQTSATKVPNDERVRPEADQIAVGIVAKSDDDAVRMALSVLALTAEVTAAV